MFHLGTQVDTNVPNVRLSTSEPILREKRRKITIKNIPPISMDIINVCSRYKTNISMN